MSTRRQARECALKMLYIVDNCNIIMSDIEQFNLIKNKLYRDFAITLFKGVCNSKLQIDTIIKRYVINWDIKRIAVVDRNILRIAIFEIIAILDTPVKVIINEAIEISKKYSTKDSFKFINGILDKVKLLRNNK
ncbi:MAG: transcription antitermination factor NusB [Endomicrobium sp.]|nr:transcription antitermination factor NusB [Endomicrobium sp.]